MFPEANLHKVGPPPHTRPGIAYLAKNTGRLVIPVGLSGTRDISFKNFWLSRNFITITFGKPFHYSDIAGRGDSLRNVAKRMMDEVYPLIVT